MSNADRALARSHVREMPASEMPISEQFRIAGDLWADAHAAATLREELKSVNLQKFKTDLITELGPMPDNRAERIVKASPKWEEYIRAMCADRAKADRLKVQMEYWKMRYGEWNSKEANARVERRL